jgi:hypothetical protein
MDIRFPPNTLEIFWECFARQVCRPAIETCIELIQGLYYIKFLPCWYWYKAGMASRPARYTPCYRCYNRARAWIADQQWLEALIIISMADGFTQKKACAKKMLF